MAKKRKIEPEAAEEVSTALVVVEPPPPPPDPKVNSWIAPKKDGVENAPDGKKPFYLVYGDGIFLHIRNVLGRALLKQKNLPTHLKKLGELGWFWWQPKQNIPAEVTAQAVNFFRRIFNEERSEAAVILLVHYETGEWSIFIPYQKVSYSSVEYAFDPTTIPEGWLVAGTMHSHCDFTAFHSSTDKADASDMNGVHFTIGHVDKEEPEIASMIMMNGTEFEYQHETLADFSNLEAATAPVEWDEFVYKTGDTISKDISEIFSKFGKKPDVNVSKQCEKCKAWYTYYHACATVTTITQVDKREWGGGWNNSAWDTYTEKQRVQREQNDWRHINDDDYIAGWYSSEKSDKSSDKPLITTYYNPSYWEDSIPSNTVNLMLDSGLLSEADLDYAVAHPVESREIVFWRFLFMKKLSKSADVLTKIGFDVEFKVTAKKVTKEDFEKKEPEVQKYNAKEDYETIIQDLWDKLDEENDEDYRDVLDGDLLPEDTKVEV